jgi:hypothetical protein
MLFERGNCVVFVPSEWNVKVEELVSQLSEVPFVSCGHTAVCTVVNRGCMFVCSLVSCGHTLV